VLLGKWAAFQDNRIRTVNRELFVRRFSIAAFLFFFTGLFAYGQNEAPPEQLQKTPPKVSAPVPLVQPDAEMPEEANKARIGGICLVSLIVDAEGAPRNPRLVRCTDPMFAKNSMDAVMKYSFKPARRVADGAAVPVMLSVEIRFRFDKRPPFSSDEPPTEIRYGFFSPPGMATLGPDADGTYPLSKQIEAPKMSEFVSKGFGQAAISFPDGVGCHIVLVLNAKGKPLTAQATSCDTPSLEKPAIDSLMKSKYKPAKLNGQGVPVRMTVHLIYDGFGPHKELGPDSPSTPSKP
jgi:hypothetical protein